MVKVKKLKEEFEQLRQDIKQINSNFTVNLHTIDKITIDFGCPLFYNDDMQKIANYAYQILQAQACIQNFPYLNQLVDYN